MWRYDANRSAASPHELPRELHLAWVREYLRLKMAWKDPINRDRMPFDKVYEPVVAGRTMFLGFNCSDKVVALDTRTGREIWTFYTDGPVRFPAAAWQGKVYFVSDDGYLYCADADSGMLIWKFRGGPSGRKILGNERLISTWPARGGPVVADGTIYFAAGIWPFMGIFIHALDAETGELVWTNDGFGATFMNQPHNAPAFAGVAPQGALVVIGDKLLVPGGRSVPACLDRRNGKELYYRLAENGKRGGSHVSAIGNHFLNHRGVDTCLYDLETGDLILGKIGHIPVLTEDTFYFSGNPVVALDRKSLKLFEDAESGEKQWKIGLLWEWPVDGTGALIKAGSRLYAGGSDIVSAIEIPRRGGKPEVTWTAKIHGTASRLVAADGRLFVVTLEGRIYCYGPKQTREPMIHEHAGTPAPPPDAMTARAETILETTGVREGYCLAYGVTNGQLVEELALRCDLRIIAFCPDAEQVDRLRRRFDAAGLYGNRIAVHAGSPMTVETPPYLASLTVFEGLEDTGFDDEGKGFLERVFHSMRPYGGVACLPIPREHRSRFAGLVVTSDLHELAIRQGKEYAVLSREGPLPASGSWTHQYGDVANTVKSDDGLVRAPLGLLWFGGSSHMDVLPRHGHGPPEQVIGGRLFIEGIDCMSARDVYAGRVLWKRELPALNTGGIYYDGSYNPDPLDTSYNQMHIPGANARGANFVAAEDRLYVIVWKACLALDPATGRTIGTFQLPTPEGAEEPPEWGYIGVYKDLLIAGAHLVEYSERYKPEPPSYWQNFDTTSSKELIVMNRYDGEVLWRFGSRLGLRHNAIVVGDNKVFCIDAMPSPVAMALEQTEVELDEPPRLVTLDVRTGEPVWSTTENVFGTMLGYSQEHDILLQAGRNSRDMIVGEACNRLIAYRGRDGEVLWDKEVEPPYSGPCMLHGDTLITQGRAFSLLTGEPRLRKHPLTDEDFPWSFQRQYGCNTAISSEHLLTFRSAAAGFFDLDRDSGTGNLGGFKSSCTSNLVVADGVLNAPDYTRTCICSYQNQTSLAMIHMPENELWTFSSLQAPEGVRVKHVGINLGAPGDRLADDGVLWLDYPSVGGPSPDIPVRIEPEKPQWFRRHSSVTEGAGLKWVGASGCNGITKLEIGLAPQDPQQGDSAAYTVRLYFADPDNDAPGRRVFDVGLQGDTVLRDLDIAKESGGRFRLLEREFKGVRVADKLIVTFSSKSSGAPVPGTTPLLCGIDMVVEE